MAGLVLAAGAAGAGTNEGLLGGSVSGDMNMNANPGNLGRVAGPQGMLLNHNGSPIDPLPDGQWRSTRSDGGTGPEHTTLIYTGEIFLQPGPTSFLMMADDRDFLSIGGQVLINDMFWNTADYGMFVNPGAAGWFSFELRCGNSGDGYGFAGQGGGTWGSAPAGFLMKRGYGSSWDDPLVGYTYPQETMDGTATLFRVPEPASLAILACGIIGVVARRRRRAS
jgi:hypothetical protein